MSCVDLESCHVSRKVTPFTRPNVFLEISTGLHTFDIRLKLSYGDLRVTMSHFEDSFMSDKRISVFVRRSTSISKVLSIAHSSMVLSTNFVLFLSSFLSSF